MSKSIALLPRWVYLVLIFSISAAIMCLVLAAWLGQQPSWLARFERTPAAKLTTPLPTPTLPANTLNAPSGPTETLVSTTLPALPSLTTSTPAIPAAAPSLPRWQLNAQPLAQPLPTGTPQIALVIDDMGVDISLSALAEQTLPPAVTLAYLPYAPQSRASAAAAHARGHEILVHVPMQPLAHNGATPHMGPHGLRVGADEAELLANLSANLAGFESMVVGVNNHMGSHFTLWPQGMQTVLHHLQQQGLLFLDSRTTARTATAEAGRGLALPLLGRDIFLDHQPTAAAIAAEWQKAVQLAQKRAQNQNPADDIVIVIGHPLPNTVAFLQQTLPTESRVTLVPITQAIYP